jgi:hypothetical protein
LNPLDTVSLIVGGFHDVAATDETCGNQNCATFDSRNDKSTFFFQNDGGIVTRGIDNLARCSKIDGIEDIPMLQNKIE